MPRPGRRPAPRTRIEYLSLRTLLDYAVAAAVRRDYATHHGELIHRFHEVLESIARLEAANIGDPATLELIQLALDGVPVGKF